MQGAAPVVVLSHELAEDISGGRGAAAMVGRDVRRATVGLAAAFGITALVRQRAAAMAISPAFSWSTLAVVGSAALTVGLAFGMYPALRAARPSPIDAIRHE